MNELKIFTDGGSRGNPGPAGIGVSCYDENNNIVFRISKQIGVATNNIAEYSAILEALLYLLEKKISVNKISFFEDSLLVVSQLNGKYKIKNQKLFLIKKEIDRVLMLLKIPVTFSYVPREQNKIADKLVNESF